MFSIDLPTKEEPFRALTSIKIKIIQHSFSIYYNYITHTKNGKKFNGTINE